MGRRGWKGTTHFVVFTATLREELGGIVNFAEAAGVIAHNIEPANVASFDCFFGSARTA